MWTDTTLHCLWLPIIDTTCCVMMDNQKYISPHGALTGGPQCCVSMIRNGDVAFFLFFSTLLTKTLPVFF